MITIMQNKSKMELAADSAILSPIKVWAACHFPT